MSGDRNEARPAATPGTIMVPVAPGELIDKITILEIKAERIAEPGKRANVTAELALLAALRESALPADATVTALTDELRAVNAALWDIEDDIRLHEARGDFGESFVALARAVYRTNDRRAALKRRISEHLGSTIVEEKSYAG